MRQREDQSRLTQPTHRQQPPAQGAPAGPDPNQENRNPLAGIGGAEIAFGGNGGGNANGPGAANAPRPPVNDLPFTRAELTPCVRNLHDLWTEYMYGIGGLKPAKDFTSQERGRFKQKYCKRKAFWDVVSRHVAANVSAPVAIERIYACYGESLCVTKILDRMAKDRKNGGHPNLRI